LFSLASGALVEQMSPERKTANSHLGHTLVNFGSLSHSCLEFIVRWIY